VRFAGAAGQNIAVSSDCTGGNGRIATINQSSELARSARITPAIHATMPVTIHTASSMASSMPMVPLVSESTLSTSWKPAPAARLSSEKTSVLRRVTNGLADVRGAGRLVAMWRHLRVSAIVHLTVADAAPGPPLHSGQAMPRFRLGHYISSTFAVTDWRAFRLCGMDEVGRGAYAGPLVAAAVVLPPRFRHPLLRDSKQLTAKQRETVSVVIRRDALAWSIAEVSVDDINTRGMGWANVDIFRRLVRLIQADGYCCDGKLRIDAAHPVHCLVKGDTLIPAISAASIIAKVYRDELMTGLHDQAPAYNWASNKGYGAREHRAAIRELGPHPLHRRAWMASVLQTEMALAV
jgi:ribonuclease HII